MSTSGNITVLSNTKQSYFIHATPDGFDRPQYVAVNRDGTIVYALRSRIDLRIEEEPGGLPRVITNISAKTICKYHVMSGKSHTFNLEDDFDASKLIGFVEFYTISDNLVVVMSYEEDKTQFVQYLMYLDAKIGLAHIVAMKRFTITRLVGPPIVNLSLLNDGLLIICGARASENGNNIRMTRTVAANPLSSDTSPDDDFSELMEDFNKYVDSIVTVDEGKKLMALFVLNMTPEWITVSLSECARDVNDYAEPLFVTDLIGRINRKAKEFTIQKVDNSAIENYNYLYIKGLHNIRVCKSSAWISFSVADIKLQNTFYWKMRIFYAKFALSIMIVAIQAAAFLRKYDRGLSFYLLAKFVSFLHGPSLIPQFCPPKKFEMYHLDLDTFKYRTIDHMARTYHKQIDPNETEFALNYDIDSSGGALVVDYPIHGKSSMMLSYYPNPTRPQRLSRLSLYSAYRNFPSFEKSSLLRKISGVIDWRWKI